MKSIPFTVAALTAMVSVAHTIPVHASLPSFTKRGLSDYAGILKDILKLVGVFLPDDADAWDYEAQPAMCAIDFSTEDGGNCKASVTCDDDDKREYNDWNVCYVGGRQYFTDNRIGDFSITFTQKDGTEGEGLTDPVLALAYVDNWREFPVSALAQAKADADDCEAHNGIYCETGPWVCSYGDTGNSYIDGSRYKPYICGMPKVGLGGNEIDSDGPVNEAGYRPGACGVHVTQYQKPDPAVDSYSLNITIYDANQNVVGSTGGAVSSASPVSLTSLLPWTMEVSTGAIDDDPVSFAYAGQVWDSNACSTGEYDSGDRDMDCGFTC